MVGLPDKNAIMQFAQNKLPPTLAVHRRQVLWQIWVPLGVLLLLVLALMVGVIYTAALPAPDVTNLSHWTDFSLIVLVIPVVVACFFVLIIVSGIVFLLARLLKILPPYTQLAQAYVFYASTLVRNWCDRITVPVIKVGGFWAGILAFFRALQK
jgi:hypothetical protein